MTIRRFLFPFVLFCLFVGFARSGWSRGRPAPWPEEQFTAAIDGRIRTGLPFSKIESVPCISLDTLQKVFGGRVQWRSASRRVTYHRDQGTADFVLDSTTAFVAGKTVALPTAVRAWGNTAYLPMALFTTPEFQNFASVRVLWSADRRSLTVDPVPSVSSPRYFSYPRHSRVAVELGPRVEYRLLGRRGETLTFRFYNGQARDWEKISVDDGLIASVELDPQSRTTDFIVTLTTAAGTPEVTLEAMTRTLNVDIPRRDIEDLPPAPEATRARAPAPPTPSATRSAPPSSQDAPYLALSPLRTIVIDPGHGGKDVGAVGPHGTLEKDVNLQVALGLAKLLNQEGRFNVVLTRSDDRFLALQERSAIANKAKADLFVSIHCNAGLKPDSRGFEIYFLSEKASDDDAAAVARRENAVVELEGVTGKARDKLEQLLGSLARAEHINESSTVAAHIARQAGKRLSVENRGVKQAGFYVLRGTGMPAVLVESAFITNAKEEGLLRSARYQRKVVDAVFAGLLDYEKRKIQTRLTQSSAGGH